MSKQIRSSRQQTKIFNKRAKTLNKWSNTNQITINKFNKSNLQDGDKNSISLKIDSKLIKREYKSQVITKNIKCKVKM